MVWRMSWKIGLIAQIEVYKTRFYRVEITPHRYPKLLVGDKESLERELQKGEYVANK